MDRSEQLYDDYEDALFALLMDKVARKEGERLLAENERLQQDPDAAVPEHIDRVCMETIRKNCARRARRRARVSARRVLHWVAIVAIILVALFMAAYAAIPELRLGTLNLMIRNSEIAARLNLEEEGGNSKQGNMQTGTLMGYKLPYIDDEFAVVEQDEDRLSGRIKYENDDGGAMHLRITKNSIQYLDIEGAEAVEQLLIHGYEAELIEKGNTIKICWFDTEHNSYIEITGLDINKEWMLNYAEQIVFAD